MNNDWPTYYFSRQIGVETKICSCKKRLGIILGMTANNPYPLTCIKCDRSINPIKLFDNITLAKLEGWFSIHMALQNLLFNTASKNYSIWAQKELSDIHSNYFKQSLQIRNSIEQEYLIKCYFWVYRKQENWENNNCPICYKPLKILQLKTTKKLLCLEDKIITTCINAIKS